jgi:hypothetical protein
MDVESVREALVSTIIETGSMGGMVCDRAGRVLIDEGATGYVDKSVVAAAIAPSVPHAVKVGPQVGGTGWSMTYYDGERYDLFSLAMGYHHFAVLIFDGSKRGAFGEVTRFGRQGIEQMIELIGEDAWTYEESIVVEEMPVEAKRESQPITVVEKRRTSAFSRDEVIAALAEQQAKDATGEMEPFLEPVDDLDIDELFDADIDDSAADDLFGDDLADIGLDLGLGESVSFDEAQDMGLLGD